jgi:MarR family transcriptional regulator for hemolysin
LYTATVKAEGQDVRAVLVQRLLLSGRRWRARLNERLKHMGQTDARCAALAEIAECSDGVVQRDLSSRLGVEEPTVVRLVDALEANGWVERHAHQLDRRAKVVRITRAAEPVLDKAQDVLARLQQEMFADIDPADLAVCLRVLTQIADKLDRPTADAL